MRSHRAQIPPLFPFLTRYLQSLDRGQRLTAVALLNTDVCSKSNGEMEVWVITINFSINNHIDDDSTTTITNNRDNNR